MKHLTRLTIALWALLVGVLAPSLSTAATYYVRKTGNDSTGDGSTGNPWLTIQKAVSTVSVAGAHTINVGDGTYAETSGGGYMVLNRSFTSPVVIQGENGTPSTVIFTSASGSFNLYQNSAFANYTFKNLTIKARSGTQCVTINQSLAFSGLRFENVTFDGDGGSGTSSCIGTASATPASAIQQTMTLVGCTFKASGGTGGWGMRVSINGSAPTGTNLTSYLYGCRSDDGSLTTGIESGPGTTLWIYGGRFFGVGGKGVLFATDTLPTGKPTTGGIYGAHIKSVSGHAFLIGGDGSGIKAFGNLIENGDHATVIKAAQTSSFQHNISKAGTINALLVKGADYGTIRYNILRGSLTNDNAVLANYDGDPLYTVANNTITDNFLILVGSIGKGIRWDTAGDAGGNLLDYNAWRDRRTTRSSTWGNVLAATNVYSVADIRAAFTSGGQPRNEKNSSASVPIITWRHSATGANLYALIFDGKGDAYTIDGMTLPRPDETGFLPQTTLPLYEEVAGSYVYEFVWPRHLAAGTYTVRFYSVNEYGFPTMADTYLGEIRYDWPNVAAKVNMLRNTPLPPGR